MNDAFVAGRWCGQRERLYRSLLVGFGGAAAADAQVLSGVVDNALKRDDDAVQETFEGVDVFRIQVLVDVVDGDGHHNEEQELQQKGEEASSARGLFGGDRAAPSGERLRVGAALSQDRALHSGLVQPVIVWFQRSASCTVDGTPAGCAVQENKRRHYLLFFFCADTQWLSFISVLHRNVHRSERGSQGTKRRKCDP